MLEIKNSKMHNCDPKLKIFLLLFLIIGAASFLRLWNLGNVSFWVDEVNTFFSARSLAVDGTYEMPSGIEHNRAPFHLYLTSLVFRLTEPNEFSTRLIPAIFGILNVLLLFLLAKKFFNWRTALLSAFFMAFSHFEIGLSRIARSYTILQFLTILFVYLMIRGLEYRKTENISAILHVKGDSVFTRLKMFFARWGVYPLWFIPAILILMGTYIYVHKLAIFGLVSLFMYSGFMAVVMLVLQKGRDKVLNKYFLLAMAMVTAGLTAVIAFPEIKTAIQYFLSYTPAWAEGIKTGRNRLQLFDFLVSEYRMPLFTLFFIGTIQAFFRYNVRGIFLFMMFIGQFLLLSFIFTHNTQTYLFNVYPFFLVLAAYGFSNLINFEILMSRELLGKHFSVKPDLTKKFEKQIANLVTVAFMLILILLPWMRVSLHVPFNRDGSTNGVVTHSGWKKGCSIIIENGQSGDIVISSLPATSLYYGVESEYALNWTLLEQAREKNTRNSMGALMEIYGGAQCVTDADDLGHIITAHNSGWVIIEMYHWENSNYIPIDVKELLINQLGEPITAAEGSILIFHW